MTPPVAETQDAVPSVLVTGASGVLGRAICLEFARAGWRVGVHYWRRREAAEQTARLVRECGGQALLLQADIAEVKQVLAMTEAFLQRWGRMSVLVCNAGRASGGLLLRAGPEEWQAVIETNLTGTFHCLQAAASGMVERRDGAVVVIASFAGLQGGAGQAAYAASKAGLLGLVKSAAREWGPFNVRVNALCPGWRASGLAGDALPDPADPDSRFTVEEHALSHFVAAESVARTVCHLAGLKDTSGQVWNLDSRIL